MLNWMGKVLGLKTRRDAVQIDIAEPQEEIGSVLMTEVAIRDVPGVASVRDMSDLGTARMLVRFQNGREFLIYWNRLVSRFEVMHCHQMQQGTCRNDEPFENSQDVFAYLAYMGAKDFQEKSFLPIEQMVENNMRRQAH